MEEIQTDRRRGKRLQAAEVIEAFRALTIPKQRLVLEAIGSELKGQTPEGLHITARSRKELRRFTRPKDPHMVDWLRGFGMGEVFYDVGANCGGMTFTAGALHGDRITIVAIEPSFASFESLARNLSSNGMLKFVVPLQMALLERTGLEMMFYRSTVAGTSQHAVGAPLGHAGDSFNAAETQLVPTFALDDLVAVLKLPPPTRLKIDVDGFELPVVRGCLRTLAAGTIRDLMIEVSDHDRSKSRLNELRTLLRQHAYELAAAFEHPAPQEPKDQDPDLCVADYLFRRVAADHPAASSDRREA